MTSHRITYLFTLVICVIFYAYYVGYFSFYLLLLVVLLPFFSLALSLPSMLGLSVRLRAPAELRRGVRGYVVMELREKHWLPVAKLRVKAVQSMPAYGEKTQRSMAYYAFTNAAVELDISTEHCHVVEYSIEKLRVSDYLDLFSFPVPVPPKVSVTVLPLPCPPHPEPELPPEAINSASLRPKQGGGFAEDHDLREYREGDPIRTVHWKLSSKRDDLIVREPLVPERREMVVTVDLPAEPSARDQVLDNLTWLSQGLLKHELPHAVRWIDQEDNVKSRMIEGEDHLEKLLIALIHSGVVSSLTRSAYGLGRGADWHYHLPAGKAGDGR